MKKRILLFFLLAALLLPTAAQAKEAAPAETAEAASFVRTRRYESNFSDVSETAWYHDAVTALYEYGLTEGAGSGSYAPDAPVTLAEVVTFAARLHALDTGETIPAPADAQTWYQPYVDALKAAGLLDGAFDGHYGDTATRAQMAGILAAALPAERYDARNADCVAEGYAMHLYITDVDDYTPYQPQILQLYKWGVVGGVDATGSFRPNDALRRSEIAALVVRMIDPAARLTLNWEILPYHSASGTTWADLTAAPASVTFAPAPDDEAAIDALLRRMLHNGSSTITLQYDEALTSAETTTLMRAFVSNVKRYCEQMYNTVTCRSYSSGRVQLTFSSTACDEAQLKTYREETLARAITIHDALWESGYLTEGMSQYELARAYFIWLCDNCVYDDGAADSGSLSHLAYNALCEGVAVCDGYTGAYNLLLRLEGIDCTAQFNTDHIWTVATLDGTRYHIDTTWGDQGTRVDMSFFAMSEAASRAKHAW